MNSGRGFNPIGNSSNYFTGVYDGDGHTISGLVINRPTTDCIGLFGVADGADIKNLGIIGVSINGDSFTGGLVGINYVQSTISNCYSTGTVSGSSYTGGLVGRNYNQSTISYCYSTGIVSGSSFTGGLVGYQFQSTISYCYSTGIVSSSSFTGGLVGYNTEYSSIDNCYSTGTVSGDYTGGLVGYNKEYSSINNCYSTGTVSGYCTGGLVGVNYVNSTISNCYSIGTVSGSSDTGGLVGYSEDSSINNSFWDITTSGQTSSAGGTGKTTAEMQDVATYTSLSSAGLTTPWDFMGNPYDDTANEDIWAIDSGFNGGYPNLSHQNGILSLSAPVPVIVYNPPDGSVTISWEAVPSAAAYKVYYSENPGAVFPAAWTLLSHVSGDELSISDTMPASRRFYRVVATTEAVVTRYRAAKVKKN